MKIKVNLKELNEASPELMSELLQYVDELITLGRAGESIANAAGKISRAGIALGKKVSPKASQFVEKLENISKINAEKFRDAVEGARKASEGAGEPVSFMFELPNGGRVTAVVNPDGLSVVRNRYRPGIAREAEEVAGKRFDYDSAPGGGAGPATRATDDVVDAGEEAAGGATRAGVEGTAVTEEFLNNILSSLRQTLGGSKYVDEAMEFAEESLKELANVRVWTEAEGATWRSISNITKMIADGKVVVKSGDDIDALYTSRVDKILDDALESNVIDAAKGGDIPLVDELGRTIIYSDGRSAVIEVGENLATRLRQGYRTVDEAAALSDELIGLVKVYDRILTQLDTLPAILSRNLDQIGGWSVRGHFNKAALARHMKAYGQMARSLFSKIWDDIKVWWFPFRGAEKMSDVSFARKAIAGIDFVFGGGVAKAIFGAIGGIGRWAGLLTKSSPGLKGTRSMARFAAASQITAIAILTFGYYLSSRDEMVDEVENDLERSLASPDPRDKLSFIILVNNQLKAQGQSGIEVTGNENNQVLDEKVKAAHKAWYDYHTKDGWFTTAAKKFAGFEVPFVYDNLMDVGEDTFQNWQKKSDLDPEMRKAVEKDEEDSEKTVYEMYVESERTLEEKLSKFIPWEPDKARKEAEQMVGGRKPEAGAEMEPDPDVNQQVPKPDQPGETIGAPKKAAQAADATDIGDFEGLDDTLFEIFNVDKPISIKVKSSSPRLRAKITEKK